MWAGASDAIELQLKNMCPELASTARTRLVDAVMANSSIQSVSREFFLCNIARETYLDVMGIQDLRDFALKIDPSPSGGQINLRCLPGNAPNEHRVLGSGVSVRDGIDLLIRVAEINAEVVTASLAGNADIQTSAGADRLLKGKIMRAGLRPSLKPGFMSISELARVLDIGHAVEAGDVMLPDIWIMRTKRSAKQFRMWLATLETCDPRELAQLSVEVVGRRSRAWRLPMRIVRACSVGLASTLLGVAAGPEAGFVGGLGLTAVDSYFVQRWVEGYSPKVFMDGLMALPVTERGCE